MALDPNANAIAAVSPPSRQPAPFLLKDNDTIDSYWLNSKGKNWMSGMALIVAGSVDIKRVREAVKKQLKQEELEDIIQIHVLHASLWGANEDKHQKPSKLKGKFLLLATHTLFSKRYSGLRDRLMIVFDTCEKHEIHWPDASHPDMEFLKHFGLCDALVTLSITKEDQRYRRERMLRDSRYRVKFIVETDDPYPDLDLGKWLARNGPLPFFGLPLPRVAPNDSFWDNLFLCKTDYPGQMKVENDNEKLRFNALPLDFLLQRAFREHRPPHQAALTLALCAVQVVTSGFAPIFQERLLTAGRWSKEATAGSPDLAAPQRGASTRCL